jgi:uncharacterized protein
LDYARYRHNPGLAAHMVDADHYAVFSPLSGGFSVVNTSALTCLQYFQTLKALTSIPSLWAESWGQTTVQSVLDQMISLGLLLSEVDVRQAEIRQTDICAPDETPDTLAAWLHITDRCNLGCTYCYLPHNNEEMSQEIGYAALEATFRSAVAHCYRKVKCKYAGGEPLLRFPFVAELHRYASRLAEQHGLELDGVVLSNGTLLTSDMLQTMRHLGLRLMISLDNLPVLRAPALEMPLHHLPAQRIYPDGRDASRETMRAVELALEYGFGPDISITVSGKNVEHLPRVLEWVLARDLRFNLNFYRPHRNVNQAEDICQTAETMIAGMLKAYQVIEANLPRWSLLASLVDLANFAAPHVRRCSVGQSYLVCDCHGRVSKCQMQMEQPVTDIHAEDPLAAVRADEAGIHNAAVDEKDGCRDCQWRYWCAGGCSLETFRATGRYDVKSPNCSLYKALYPEVLRLEGLRLLKYAGTS